MYSYIVCREEKEGIRSLIWYLLYKFIMQYDILTTRLTGRPGDWKTGRPINYLKVKWE